VENVKYNIDSLRLLHLFIWTVWKTCDICTSDNSEH